MIQSEGICEEREWICNFSDILREGGRAVWIARNGIGKLAWDWKAFVEEHCGIS